jgi:hypothetical protein
MGGSGTVDTSDPFLNTQGSVVGVLAVPRKQDISQSTTIIWSGRTGKISGMSGSRRFAIFGNTTSSGSGGALVADYGWSFFSSESFVLMYTANFPAAGNGVDYFTLRAKATVAYGDDVSVISFVQMLTLRR